MTNTPHRINSKIGLMILMLTLMSSFAIGQIDSIQVNFTSSVSPFDSQLQMTTIQINGVVENPSDFGGVHISIFSAEDVQVAGFKKSKSELETDSNLIGNLLSVNLTEIDYSTSYRIEFHPRRSDGANYPVIIQDYNN